MTIVYIKYWVAPFFCAIARLRAEINHQQAHCEGIRKGGAPLRGHAGSFDGEAERLRVLEKRLDRGGEGRDGD